MIKQNHRFLRHLVVLAHLRKVDRYPWNVDMQTQAAEPLDGKT